MDHEELLTPVALYCDRLKAEHAQRVGAAFEELFKRSQVDAEANAAEVRIIHRLEKVISALEAKLKTWRFFRVLAILLAIGGAVLGGMWLYQKYDGTTTGGTEITTPVGLAGFAGTAVALLLIFGVLNGRIRKFDAQAAARRAERQKHLDTAWRQMEPLNRLFHWDTMTKLVMQTLPIMAIDRYVSAERLRQLVQYFKWSGADDPAASVLACQSGTVNGNPYLIAEELRQTWGVKTYTGTLTISWQEKEYYTDSNGKQCSRWVTRHEVLVATVDKPIPVYARSKRLIYGSEAAPELKFSRQPNALSDAGDGFWDRRRLKSAIADLEKKSRDLNDPFTIMDNREFDACFHAVDRSSEQQFRLLFTPLAQQEMLTLLRDREQGYGDDFTFRKTGMINQLTSVHLDRLDISGTPQQLRSYDLAAARSNFNTFGNEFFRGFYFSFAPLFAIPLYQQHRNFPDIYAGVITSGAAARCEYEAVANAFDVERFRPAGAVTDTILKTAPSGDSGDVLLTVTAHAFYTEDRVDYVSKYGGDGKWHQVPVPWKEYLPVSRRSTLAICVADTDDPQEFAAKLDTPEWQTRLKALGVSGAPLFRRGLAAFCRPK